MERNKLQKLLMGYNANQNMGIKRLLAAIKTNEYDKLELTVIYAQILAFYSKSSNTQQIIKLFEQYKKLNILTDYANSIDIYSTVGIAYGKSDKHKDAITYLNVYERLLTAYKNGEINTPDLQYRKPVFVGNFEVAALAALVLSYDKTGNSDEALRIHKIRKKLITPGWDETMLTIGMIVKNEEKTLEQCLESLSSLRKNVKCELIIVDTGSTDRTLEIAEQYADEVRHFKWINDFSAARNESLRDAKGDWFMFIDGDEIFENTDEIEEFFTTSQNIHYNFGSYIQRNYSSETAYSDFAAPRMSRILENTKFTKSIHESLPLTPPVIYFKDYVHHRGYQGKQIHRKNSRNISSLHIEHAKDPNNILVVLQLSEAYMTVDYAVAKEYLELGLKLSQEKKIFMMETIFRAIICSLYVRQDQTQKAYDYAKESSKLYDNKKIDFCITADIYAILTISASKLKKDFSEISDAFEKFYKIYDFFSKTDVVSADKMVHTAIYMQRDPSSRLIAGFVNDCIDHNEFIKAAKYVKHIVKPAKSVNFTDSVSYIKPYFIIMFELNDYSDLSELIREVVESDTTDDVRIFFYRRLLAQITILKKQTEIERSEDSENDEKLSDNENKAPEYIFDGNIINRDYIKILKESIDAQKEGTVQEDFRALALALDKFYNHGGMTDEEIAENYSTVEKITPVCSDIFPLLALFGHNLDVIADKLDDELIYAVPEKIVIYGGVIADIITDYTSKIDLEKISQRQQLLLLNLCLSILYSLKEDSKFDPETIANIISTISACYLETVYKPEVINEANIEHMILPLQLGFY
ncbi:MAG: glycosyltransferase, partial [Oscillospiraceae bacterium]|nr:glycosyltransferase [Oscillospiraceae bacterium]